MRQDKRARVEVDAGDGHEKPTGADNDDDQMEEARGGGRTEQSINTSSSRKTVKQQAQWRRRTFSTVEAAGSTSQAIPNSNARSADAKYRWTDRTGMPARTRGKDQGKCRSSSQDQRNCSRQSTRAAPAQPLQQNDLRRNTKGNDIGMVEDIVTIPGGQQVYTLCSSSARPRR